MVFVADLDRSVRFYTEIFGMDVIAREPRANAAFLRLPRSGNHHDLGLFGVGTAGGAKRRGAIGLYHLAWQLDTIDELVAAREELLDAGAYTGESSHGATKSLYGVDPDGNEFELMWCCLATSGAPMRVPPRSTTSTSPGKSNAGAASAPPGTSRRALGDAESQTAA